MTKLKWTGDALMLGKTNLAEVRTRCEGIEYDYVIGPGDFTSEPSKLVEHARAACEGQIRASLAKANVVLGEE